MSTTIKKRHWAFVLYPDSAPPDWLSILQFSGISFAVSPLHDKDINPTGEVKKPHYHVILSWSGPTTIKAVQALCQSKLNGTIPIDLESPLGMYRYFTHKDNPEKHQYNAKDIICGGGFDASEFEIMTFSAVEECLSSIVEDIVTLGILEYADLIEYYFNNRNVIKLRVARTNTHYLNAYLTSRRHRYKDMLTRFNNEN